MKEVTDLIASLQHKDRDYLNNFLANAPKWLLESFQVVHIKKNTAFIHENAEVNTVYILVEGIVKATDYRVYECVYDYARFSPVETFGAMEFLVGCTKYKTTLITETDCRFLRISKDQFEKWMVSDIHAVLMQVNSMTGYMLEQVRKERLFLLLQGTDRLYLLFMQMYQKSSDHKVCRIRLTRKEMAGSTGLSTKTVDRCLREMEKEGSIAKEGRTILIDEKKYQMIEKLISEKIDNVN